MAYAAVVTGEAVATGDSIGNPISSSPSRTRSRARARRRHRFSTPSSSKPVSATSNASITLVGTVVGCGCHPLHSSENRFQVARLRYQPAAFARPSARAFRARGPAATGATPIGPPTHLLATVTQRSTSHASISNGTPPTAEMPSTIVSAPCSRAALQMPSTSLRMPTEVSWCTTHTALTSRWFASASRIIAAVTGSASPGRTMCTRRPLAVATSAILSPKRPFAATSTSSPGPSTLAMHISTPAMPEPKSR